MKPLTKQERDDRREERKAARNNADIRPFIQLSEAAEFVLSKIIKTYLPQKAGPYSRTFGISRATALKFACPQCKAEPLSTCIGARKPPQERTSLHMARYRAAATTINAHPPPD